jgi:hypothetical protein
MRLRLALLLLTAAAPLLAQEEGDVTLRGRVLDARTGEPIAKALVSIRDRHREAVTDETGWLEIPDVPRGPAELYVSTVGYGLVKRTVDVPPDADTPLVISLGQEAIKRSEAVSVRAGVFDPVERDAPFQHTLDNVELKNLASVLADDSLRPSGSRPGRSSAPPSAVIPSSRRSRTSSAWPATRSSKRSARPITSWRSSVC